MLYKNIVYLSIVFNLSIVSHSALAENLKWFAGAGVGLVDVYDPDGDTNSSMAPIFLGGGKYQLSRTTSVKVEGFYYSTSPSSDHEHIALNYKGYGIDTQYQWAYVYSRNIRPRFGLGLSVQKEKSTDRYTTDAYGYLVKQYDDNSQIGFGVSSSVEFDFELWKQSFSTTAKYIYGINSTSLLSLSISYNF